jgi:N-formylglutamate amidohydrolase
MARVNPLRNSKILLLCGVFSIFLFLFIVVPEFQNHFPIPISVDVEPIQLTSELLLEPIYGYNNYSEFIQGHLPIIISIPHGGHLFPEDIPDRKQTFPSVVKSNDINTQEIGRELADLITETFKGRKPYMVINHLGRSKLDVNRPLKEGAEGIPGSNLPSETQIAWSDYHTFLNNAVEEIEERFGRGLLIDIHGETS